MKTHERDLEKPSFWQLVFLQSKVNGAAYYGEQLPRRNWNWPKDTYFQHRLRRAKWYRVPDKREFELGYDSHLFDRIVLNFGRAIRP